MLGGEGGDAADQEQADDEQRCPGQVDRVLVDEGAVEHRFEHRGDARLGRAEQPVERATIAEGDAMPAAEDHLEIRLVLRHPVVHPPGQLPDLRPERAAQRHVDPLEAPADAEERPTAHDHRAHPRTGGPSGTRRTRPRRT